ncbi:MAG: hypothetical protein SXA11_15225 [Cyanobacteriota bacterium]|nr:hypothetical protein [Cyanobacteriota bacterium]
MEPAKGNKGGTGIPACSTGEERSVEQAGCLFERIKLVVGSKGFGTQRIIYGM